MAKISIIRQTRDVLQPAVKEAKEHWKEPPEAQVPVNDSGWYTSPNLQNGKAVSPTNCSEWPDSPYCGGNPWTKTPVGFELDYGVDKCGAWVEATPVLGFTKLPPVSVGYRNPGECREEKKPPPPPPTDEDDGRPVSPLNFPDDIDPNVPVFVVVGRIYKYVYNFHSGYYYFPPEWIKLAEPSSYKYIEKHWLESSNYPTNSYVESYYPYPSEPKPVPGIGIATLGYQSLESSISESGTEQIIDSGIAQNWIASDQKPPWPSYPNYKRFLFRDGKLKGNYFITRVIGNIDEAGSFLLYGTLAEIKKDWEGWVIDYRQSGARDNNQVATINVWKEEWKILYISIPDKSKQPPPPNAERKRKCCMQCCNSGGSQQQNKQDKDNSEILRLLRKIDKKMGEYPFNVVLFDSDDDKVGAQSKTVSVASVAEGQKLIVEREEKNAKSIGIDHFPIYAPSSIVEDESNGLLGDIGDLKNKIFKQKIESLAELQLWRVKNDYEIFGRWQEVIEVEDSDPTKKGNQRKRVILPNMAKSFKEIILLLTVLIRAQGFSLDAILKMYVDIAGVKSSTAVTEAITRDIQDYLDYPTNAKTLDVPVGIKIPKEDAPVDDKEDIEDFLKSSTVKVVFDDWTGEGSIHDMLLVLLDAASRTIQKPHT